MIIHPNDMDQFKGGELLPLVEEFYTIQGEGHHVGKPAYFIRIGGCDVGCSWCDTKYSWSPMVHPLVSVSDIGKKADEYPAKAVVVTGGEPSMYNLFPLTRELKKRGMVLFLETSGAYPLTGHWDWICLSPKRSLAPQSEIFSAAHELKVIISGQDDFNWAEINARKVGNDCFLYLQPEWSRFESLIHPVVEYAKKNPRWNISLQAHKFMHIP